MVLASKVHDVAVGKDDDVLHFVTWGGGGWGDPRPVTRADVGTVSLVGVSTSGCVRATAVAAIQHNFVPIVFRDAVGDRDDAVWHAALHDLQVKYAEVVLLGDLSLRSE